MFITKTDITRSGIHAEVLDALIRNADETIDDIISFSIDEMAGYLDARYDTNDIFSKTGNYRNGTLLQKGIDIALYHIHCKGNPNVIPDIRVKRYDDAIDWLKGIQKGNINPPGLTIQEDENGYSNIMSFGSNPKRVNHY